MSSVANLSLANRQHSSASQISSLTTSFAAERVTCSQFLLSQTPLRQNVSRAKRERRRSLLQLEVHFRKQLENQLMTPNPVIQDTETKPILSLKKVIRLAHSAEVLSSNGAKASARRLSGQEQDRPDRVGPSALDPAHTEPFFDADGDHLSMKGSDSSQIEAEEEEF